MKIWVHGFGNGSGTGTPPPSFNDPSDIVGIQEWWNTGAGVSETANVVNSWTGQINGTVLTTTGGTGMTYNSSDSNVNNQPSFINDSTKFPVLNNNITTFTPSLARSMFFVAKPNLVTSGNNFIGGQGDGLGPDADIKFYTSRAEAGSADKLGAYFVLGANKVSTTNTQNEVLTFIITISTTTTATYNMKFKGSSASTFSVTGLGDMDEQTPFALEAGAYTGISPKFDGTIMEFGFVNGAMTLGDISNLQTYVDNKY